jgi:tetratricopeptide (TPR) repeat protein
MAEPIYPVESKSAEIGRHAVMCFNAHIPTNWIPQDMGGPTDFGIDYDVQVKVASEVRYRFRSQVKGSERNKFSQSEDAFSVELKTSTLNYYTQITEPILLVFCDLSDTSKDPRECPAYFVWIHEEIQRAYGSNRPSDSNQAQFTVHVPKRNKLSASTDFNVELRDHVQIHNALHGLDAAVVAARSGLHVAEHVEVLESIERNVRRTGRPFVDAVTQSSSTPWPAAAKGSFAAALAEVANILRRGDDQFARERLDAIRPDLSKATPHEQAEFFHLLGKSHLFTDNDADAEEAFRTAADGFPDEPKYQLAFIETRFRREFEPGKPFEAKPLLERLRVLKTSEARVLESRVLGASGLFEESLAVLSGVPVGETRLPRCIAFLMNKQWSEAENECSLALASTLTKDHERPVFHMFRARARFFQSMPLELDGGEDEIIPIYGPANVDTARTKEVWADVSDALSGFARMGWPSNAEYLSDISSVTAVVVGKEEELLSTLQSATSLRPSLTGLQGTLERVALLCGKVDVALKALEKQPQDADAILRRLILLGEANRHQEALDLFEKEKSSIPQDHHGFPIALSVAAYAANKLVRVTQARDYESALFSRDDWAEVAALHKFYAVAKAGPLGRSAAVAELAGSFSSHPDWKRVPLQLFGSVDISDEAGAVQCIEFASIVRRHQQLDFDGVLRLGQALATAGRWQVLASEVEEALKRFGPRPRLLAIQALTFDKLGNTAAALSILRRMVTEGEGDVLATNTLINILCRCGLVVEGIALVEGALAREKDKHVKLQLLRALFNLVFIADPRDSRTEEIAWRFGELADPNIEAEEGLFLLLYLSATVRASPANDARREIFQKRLEAFTSKFPESKILRAAQIPQSATGEELLAALDAASGGARERFRKAQELQAELHAGRKSVPFAWRPRLLPNVGDVAALWHICKISSVSAVEYQLLMEQFDPKKPDTVPELSGPAPIFDLVSLLVIQDLDLFDTLFKLFPRIAIAQRTLLLIQNLTHPFIAGIGYESSKKLVNTLSAYLDRIEQPWVTRTEDSNPIDEEGEEIRTLVLSRKFRLYSDDALFRLYCQGAAQLPSPLCSGHLMRIADAHGLLTPNEVGLRLGKLTRWNVGVVVQMRYLIGLVSAVVGAVKDFNTTRESLDSSPEFRAMVDGLWAHNKPRAEVVQHFASVCAELLAEPLNSPEMIAALWAIWDTKAKLRSDLSMIPRLRRLADTMAVIASLIKNPNEASMGKLWASYVHVVAAEFGKYMDERIEKDARMEVGGAIARISKDSAERARRLLQALELGLTNDTLEHEMLHKGFAKTDIASAVENAKKRE